MIKESKYIKINNADGKMWLLPEVYLTAGFNIYQPSSFSGRLLKKGLPIIYKIQILRWLVDKVLKIEHCDLDIPETVRIKIEELFEKEIILSYFSGTPSVHMKPTVQISTTEEILGYAKFTAQKNIFGLFSHEKQALDYLQKKGIVNIPKSLFCEQLSDEYYLFVQDTIKTEHSKSLDVIKDEQIEFVKTFCDLSEVELEYSNTDYYYQVHQLLNHEELIRKVNIDAKTLEEVILFVDKTLECETMFSGYHGDFTPWNSLCEGNKFFVFDFEYFQYSYPKYLDILHYYTQYKLFSEDISIKKLEDDFKCAVQEGVFKELFVKPHISYMQYLLAIICFYILRSDEILDEKDIRNVGVWYGTLIALYSDIKEKE